ncbi:bifunctional metallophosphatase/5'-nucleotidase [Numidum massiliense]|uniref:bifunctional metallophosphatase/5'-nucleotidase n=1 Tax=Numidum massiliense TaxID=1522315 RepID=UPI0006D580B4|nr:bifunctional UDP-sugar hydrolase/5'-nucleotidase [Numidum massiliense]
MEKQGTRQTVTILETSDVHGNILPLNYGINRPMELGLAKLAALIRRERKQNPHTLLIDNGDLIQGTPLSYYHACIDNEPVDPLVSALNELKYDAAVFGNHEFNYGQDVLQKAMREAKFPWLSANIVKKGTDEPYYGKPYIVKTLPGGLKVGVLGLTTHYIPNWEKPAHIAALDFRDALETAKEWVPVLRDREGVDVLVVSYHGGFERDLEGGGETEAQTGENQGYRLCYEVPGIDVLLTGHQHRLLAQDDVNGVAIVQPGSQGTALGKVTLTVEKKAGGWAIVEKGVQLLSAAGVTPDETVVRMTEPYEVKTQQWLDQPIGHIKGDMRVHDPMQIRLKDNALIEFFNKVQMAYAGVDISNTALFDNYAPGLPSDVTMRDVVANYIYPNSLRVLRLQGKDIKAALERSASYFAPYTGGAIEVSASFKQPKPQHYNYDMWEGIDYVINISRPVGERVVKLTYRGEPLDMDGTYDVVMNNYRAGGGGDYFMFQGKPVIKDIPIDVSELIADYIRERGTIEATVDGNWAVVCD